MKYISIIISTAFIMVLSGCASSEEGKYHHNHFPNQQHYLQQHN